MLASGCLVGGPSGDDGAARERVVPEIFAATLEPWSFFSSSGCGTCSGAGGGGPHAEHHALFVFGDGRLLLVEFNEGAGRGGFQANASLGYDAAQLEVLLADVPRADAGETWVVRVATGRLTDPSYLLRLDAAWTTPGEPTSHPLDGGAIDYARRMEDGAVERHRVTGPLSHEDPFVSFAGAMQGLERDLRVVGAWRPPGP